MKKKKKAKRDKAKMEEQVLSVELGRFKSYGRRLREGFKILSANERD